jgi:AcrR family transcriptional regulator
VAKHHDNARERILNTFEDLLIAQGDSPVTLEGVAIRAQLTKGGLLYHFPSRAALVTALVDRFDRRTQDDLAEMTHAPEGAAANYLKVSDYLASPLHRTTMAMSQLANSEPAAADSLARSREAELEVLTADVGDPVISRLTMVFAEGLLHQASTRPAASRENVAVVDWFKTQVLAAYARRPARS